MQIRTRTVLACSLWLADHTMQPAEASLWLRPPAHPRLPR